MANTKRTRRHPITGQDVVPADLMAAAKKPTPFNQLTKEELDEFNKLSPAAQAKLIDIADAALIGAAAVDTKDSSVAPNDANSFLNSLPQAA